MFVPKSCFAPKMFEQKSFSTPKMFEQKSCFKPKMFAQMFPNSQRWYCMMHNTWINWDQTVWKSLKHVHWLCIALAAHGSPLQLANWHGNLWTIFNSRGERFVNPLPDEASRQSGDKNKKPTLWGFFFLLAFGQWCPLVSDFPASILSHIACTSRNGQI